METAVVPVLDGAPMIYAAFTDAVPDLLGRAAVAVAAIVVLHRLLRDRRTVTYDPRRRSLYFLTWITGIIATLWGILFNLGLSDTFNRWASRVAIVLIVVWIDRVRHIIGIAQAAETKVRNGDA